MLSAPNTLIFPVRAIQENYNVKQLFSYQFENFVAYDKTDQ